MRLGKGFAWRALPVLLAALIMIIQLPRMDAGAEFAAPLPTFGPSPNASDYDSGAESALFLNSHERESLEPGETAVYRFTPSAADDYILRSFPEGENAQPVLSARLIRESDGSLAAQSGEGKGFRIACALLPEETYLLEITAVSDGAFALEVMLDTRGRSFENPISLPEETVRYAKTIVRPRDVHWFSFTAPVSGWYSIRTETTGGAILDTKGYLMDDQGRLLAENDDILFPGDANFMIQHQLTAGKTYFVRISAFSNLTGAYRLVLTMPGENQALPEEVSLSRHDLLLDVDQEFSLSASVSPKGALDELVYASSNASVVSVEPDGTVTGVSAGEATIWVFSYGEVKDSCRVTVRPVEVTGMTIAEESVSLYAQEQLTLSPVFEPANASDQTVKYVSSDESVVTVSRFGVLTGHAQGEATITASSSDGSFTDSVSVSVKGVRPVYRALVIGEHTYADETRLGGLNTAEGIYDLLESQRIDGGTYQATLLMDSTRAEIEAGIREAFAGAKETDISLIYINCHGAYEDGSAFIRLHDESRLTAQELESMLRPIPGKIILLLDFCQSGAFIGAGGAFAEGARTALTDEKYIVFASASADEDSYRRSFASGDAEKTTAAIMGRSLAEGAGWDLIYDRSVSLKADADRDKRITVQELFEYTKKRVSHYLTGTGAAQTVHLWAEDDQTVLFGRE